MSKAHRTHAWRKAATARKTIAAAHNEPCTRCGQPIDYTLHPNNRLGATIDHLDPLALGGDPVPTPDLLAPAHRACNSRHGQALSESKRRNKHTPHTPTPHLLQISGPPCAGKSTRLQQLAQQGWTTWDEWTWHQTHHGTQHRDQITDHQWRAWYRHLHRITQHANPNQPTAYIRGNPAPLTPNATVELLDPGPTECHNRANHDQRPQATHQWIDTWYAKYGGKPRTDARPVLPGPTSLPRPQASGLAPESHHDYAANIETPFTDTPWTRPANAGLPLKFPPPHPDAVGSHGDAAAAWINERMAADPNAEGDGLLWWQWLVLQRALEHRADGSLLWPLALLNVMRQQGKSLLLCELAMWRAAHPELFGEKQRVLHAARVSSLADQQQEAARSWADEQGLTGSRRKADSYITWPDGSYWHVMALNAVWGQRVSLALLDEGWDMTPARFWKGLWPAMAMRRQRQAWVFSASNDEDRGLVASLEKRRRCCVMAWGTVAGDDLLDEATWHRVTPHMTPDRLEAMRDASDAPGFATEWLNLQPKVRPSVEGFWLPGWAELPRAAIIPPFTGVGAVEVSANRATYGTAIAHRWEDGSLDVWTARHPNLDAASEWLKGRSPAVVLAGLSIKDQLLLPCAVEGVGMRETRYATPLLGELVRNGRVRHDHGQAMTDELGWSRVTRTEYGDVLSAKASDGPIGTVKAAAWAVWAAATGAVSSENPEIW